MLNFLNPPDKDSASINDIVNNMGSFYNMFDYQSKERLKTYFNSLLVSMEGLYYNLIESAECYDLNGPYPYLDFSYNEITLNSTDAEIEKVGIPILANPTIIGTGGTEDYSYAVTALDNDGVETPISNIKVAHNAPDTLNGTDKVRLTWNSVGGAASYNIYGRTIANLDRIGNTTSTTFDDEGQALTSATPPSSNETIWYYLVDIPLDYYFFNITYLGDFILGTDFTIDKFTKFRITNISEFKDTNKKYILKGAYAFLPILLSLYLSGLTNSDNYLQILYDGAYPGYLNEAQIEGNTSIEKLNKKWVFHINKLMHNISLLTRRALNITNLEKILSLIYNAPFAYDAGTLGNISTAGGYTTFTIGDYYYKIPDTLSLLKSNGASIEKYEILVSTATIEDAYTPSTSVSPTDDFNENRLIDISIPGAYNSLGKHTLLVDSFYNNILPKNLEII
jgi:hypothetical protein